MRPPVTVYTCLQQAGVSTGDAPCTFSFFTDFKKHQAGRNTPSLHPKSFEGEILSEWIKVMLFINFSSVLKLRVLKKERSMTGNR